MDGAQLLDSVAEWIEARVYLPEGAAHAVALWVVATWFVDVVDYAPLLQLHSATKRSGKTLLLDLIHPLVRRGFKCSGVGITVAALFRFNESERPTLLIDEAEKLSGIDHAHEFIGLLNDGYLRGGKVLRVSGDNHEVRAFDAFGFRAVAAIGSLWDTIEDRAIRILLTRKPREISLQRINILDAMEEGVELARRACRWAQDSADVVAIAARSAPRPDWMDDRACDCWAPLFAVASVAGAEWPERAEESAKALARKGHDGDRGEQMIHDLRHVFAERGNPEVISSSQVVEALNGIETSPWGDYRHREGISTHKLAHLMKPFGVKPSKARPKSDGTSVRGWWLQDLVPLFEGYSDNTPPSELSQVVQVNDGAGFGDSESVPGIPSRDTLKTSEAAWIKERTSWDTLSRGIYIAKTDVPPGTVPLPMLDLGPAAVLEVGAL